MKNVAIVIASKGFQQVEYTIPKKLFEEHKHSVITLSDQPGKAVGKDGSQIKVDLALNKADITKYDALVLVGGPGALEALDNDATYRIIQDAVQNNLIVGAICISTRVLAKSGVLASKKATGWDEDGELADLYRAHGVIYIKQPVVTDYPFVTAVGPQQAQEFAKAIIELL